MMLSKQSLARMQCLTAVAVVLAAGALAQAQDGNAPPTAAAGTNVLPERRPHSGDMTLLVDQDHGTTTSDRWIGVVCTPMSDPLRAQLKLPAGQGLLVREVVPDSPAAKAGLQRYDIVLAANDKPLERNAELVAAVHAAGDGGLELRILRGGDKKTISVQPAKRPEDRSGFRFPQGEPFRWLQPLIDDGRGLLRGADELQLRRIAPGVVVWTTKPPLPDDVSITIKKRGGKPAQITVEQGDQKWEASEDQLKKLPAKVRGYIASLGHGISGANISVAIPEEVERRSRRGRRGREEDQPRGYDGHGAIPPSRPSRRGSGYGEDQPRATSPGPARPVPDAYEQRLKKLEHQLQQLLERVREQKGQDSKKEDE